MTYWDYINQCDEPDTSKIEAVALAALIKYEYQNGHHPMGLSPLKMLDLEKQLNAQISKLTEAEKQYLKT